MLLAMFLIFWNLGHTLVFNDIPSRFPTLRFGFIETSAQWVP